MNASPESWEAWQSLLTAYDDHCALSDISYAVCSLHASIEGEGATIASPISEGLRNLLSRTKELSEAFDRYEGEIELSYQNAAWRYAEIGYGMRPGNRIEFTDWRGKLVIGAAERLSLADRKEGRLTLRVLLLRKDGTVGKKEDHINLPSQNWKNLDAQDSHAVDAQSTA